MALTTSFRFFHQIMTNQRRLCSRKHESQPTTATEAETDSHD